MISASVDSQAVMANLKKLVGNVPKAQSAGAQAVAEEILRLSQSEVPHDEGTLQNSGTVQQDGDDWIVGYHTPYAARLHEHPEYNFQAGRKGKYLEDPIVRNQEPLGIMFGEEFEDRLEP